MAQRRKPAAKKKKTPNEIFAPQPETREETTVIGEGKDPLFCFPEKKLLLNSLEFLNDPQLANLRLVKFCFLSSSFSSII